MMIKIYENETDIENAYLALMSEVDEWRVTLRRENYIEISQGYKPLIAVAFDGDTTADVLLKRSFSLIKEKVGNRAKEFIIVWACSDKYPLCADIAKGIFEAINEQDEDTGFLWGYYVQKDADLSRAMVFAFGE